MVMQNYVVLQTGKPTRLHFVAHDIVTKTIVDPQTKRPKMISSLVFQVDELDGMPAMGHYSVVATKHARDFEPYLPGDKYRSYDFIITQSGEGFLREYSVQVLPRK